MFWRDPFPAITALPTLVGLTIKMYSSTMLDTCSQNSKEVTVIGHTYMCQSLQLAEGLQHAADHGKHPQNKKLSLQFQMGACPTMMH